MNKKDLKNICKRIKKYDSFCLFVHTSPDSDCVSCAMSVGYALLKSGKKVEVFTEDKEIFFSIRSRLASLLPQGVLDNIQICTSFSESKLLNSKPALMFLDCSEYSRIGRLFDDITSSFSTQYIDDNLLVIDHHINTAPPSGTLFIDNKCSSASELCYRVLTHAFSYLKKDANLAKIAFFGIAGDTGFFKFLRTGDKSADTLALASYMTKLGVEPNTTSAFIYPKNSEGYNQYFAHLLLNTEYIKKDNCTIAFIKDVKYDYELFGREKRPTGALFDMLFGTEGVQVIVFLKYSDEGFTECSVRVSALSSFKANEFCSKFSGGGHEKAAGFRVEMSCEDVEKDIRKLL